MELRLSSIVAPNRNITERNPATAPPRRPEQVEMRRAGFLGHHPPRDKEHPRQPEMSEREHAAATAPLTYRWSPTVPVRPVPRPLGADSVQKSLGRNKTLFPMSKGLIWLMFHALQVRQGPMEN